METTRVFTNGRSQAVQEKYPEAASLTMLDFATFSATGLKTQQVMNFEG